MSPIDMGPNEKSRYRQDQAVAVVQTEWTKPWTDDEEASNAEDTGCLFSADPNPPIWRSTA